MLQFTITGTPIPQGSKRHVGNGRMIEANPKLRPWRAVVTQAALQALGNQQPFSKTDGITVELAFFVPRPKTVNRSMPTVKPDIDKLARAILDGITDAGIWPDDSQVVKLQASKNYTSDTLGKVLVKILRFSEKSV